jgi:hypothetical protein
MSWIDSVVEERIVGCESRCLVDAGLLMEAARCGRLEELCGGGGVATGELTLASVRYWRDDAGECHVIDLGALVADGRLEVLSASATEVAAVVRWVGSGALGSAELELVALVMAGKGGLGTADSAVRRMAIQLGLEERLEQVEDPLGCKRVMERGSAEC